MPSYERFESDPDEYLSRDLLDIREIAEEDPLLLRGENQKIAAVIRRGLTSEFHYDSTVGTIFYLLTVAISDAESKLWFEPIVDVVEQHPVMGSRLFEVGFREAMLDFRNLVGVCADLNSARPIVVDKLLQAYIKLIKLLSFKPGLSIPPTLFDQALSIAGRLDDHVERDKLYQAIALCATHNSEFEIAERYALLAYNDAEFIEDADRIVDAACTLAIVYRFQQRFSKADYYIRRAMSKASSQTPDIRFATLFYENGVYCYRHDKFELSRSYYERALAIFEKHAAVYQIAMTHHAQAQTSIYLKDFAKAEALIHSARETWERLGNDYDRVNSFFVEADLELKRGNRLLGIQIMRRSIDMAYSQLDDTPARDFLLQRIQEHIERNS